MQAKQDCLLAA